MCTINKPHTDSIFTTNGAEWQHSRAILRPAFVRDQISDLACVDRHVEKLIARIRAATADGAATAFDLQAMFSMMTTDSISDFMFGQSTDLQGSAPPDSYTFGKYFDESMQKIAWRARLGWLTLLRSDPELDEYSRFMRAFVKRFVSDVRDRPEMNTHRGDAGKYVFLDELLKSGESDEVICDHREFPFPSRTSFRLLGAISKSRLGYGEERNLSVKRNHFFFTSPKRAALANGGIADTHAFPTQSSAYSRPAATRRPACCPTCSSSSRDAPTSWRPFATRSGNWAGRTRRGRICET